MKLEEQITNLELSKKLKELGVKQESLFYWVEFSGLQKGHQDYKTSLHWELRNCENNLSNFPDKISAFTVAELGEMLKPYAYYSNNMASDFPTYQENHKSWGFINDEIKWVYADTEANARAKMLIYLIENKLL